MKVWNYMIIMLTMMIFLTLMGFKPIGAEGVLDSFNINISSSTGQIAVTDLSNSLFYNQLITILLLTAGAGAIIVGLFSKQFDWKIGMVPIFTLFVIKFVSFGWNIVYMTSERWLQAITATIFLPLTAMFIFSIVEWFSSGDN